MDLIEKMSVKLGLGYDGIVLLMTAIFVLGSLTSLPQTANNDIVRILENRNWTVLKPGI